MVPETHDDQRRRHELSSLVDIKYSALFEAIDEAVCFLEKVPTRADGRRDYRYLAANRAMRELFGVDDLIGRSSRDTFTDDSETWYDDFDRVLATGEAMRVERETTRHGLALSIFVAPVEDGTGSQLVAVIRDVTARNRADAALRENETRYRACSTPSTKGSASSNSSTGRTVHCRTTCTSRRTLPMSVTPGFRTSSGRRCVRWCRTKPTDGWHCTGMFS